MANKKAIDFPVKAASDLPGLHAMVFNPTDGQFYGTDVKNLGQVHINVMLLGAKADGVTNDLPAFNLAIDVARNALYGGVVYAPAGIYKLNGKLEISGGTDASEKALTGISFYGDGARKTILDFTSCTDSIAVQFGSANKNTLQCFIKGFSILGHINLDGLVVSSWVPYANAFNDISDIYIRDCRDGHRGDMDPSFTSSNFANKFTQIQVENYNRIGFHQNGVYSSYKHLFVTQDGAHYTTYASNGVNEKGLFVDGGSSTFEDCQFQDEIKINGAFCRFYNIAIETIPKAGSSQGNTAIVVAGQANTLDGFVLSDFKNTTITQVASIFGNNTTLNNWSYVGNQANTNIAYGVIPAEGSSGSMKDIDVPASFGPDSSAFDANTAKWAFDNVRNNSTLGRFTRLLGLATASSQDTVFGNVDIGSYNTPKRLAVEGDMILKLLGHGVAKIKVNNADGSNAGLTLQYTKDGGATATAAVSGGHVTAINVTNGGGPYTDVPDVVIGGGGGTGATATAVVTGGVITAINVTNPGVGYTSAPSVGFTGNYQDGISVNYQGITTTHKITADNDVEITDAAKGIIMRTSDGTRARITLVKTASNTLTLQISDAL